MKSTANAHDSQTSILDAAEKTFANFGFAGTSLRQIVEVANANLATVYYHFGSKEGLMDAVFRRVFVPVHEAQLRDLRKLEGEYKGKPVPLKKLLTAMLLPPLRLATSGGKSETIMRMIGRAVSEPNSRMQELCHRLHHDVRLAFFNAIHRSASHLSKADLWWRFEFVWGAYVFVLCNPTNIKKITDGACDPSNADALLAQMTAVFSAGFQAPSCAKRQHS